MARLLIVDDDVITRMLLNRAMQRDGHQVTEACTGEESLKLAQKEEQDIILLDAQMPGMDGFTCCANLKASMREKCPPVIMITGLADQSSVDRAFAVGAIDYATKPIHLSILRHRVHQVLRERELMQQLATINQQLASTNRELQYLTRVDSLTQVANRRSLEETLIREWARLMRAQKPLGVILCDIDFFKRYNDLYGHPAGDYCLKQVSRLLQLSILRPVDFVARYGGEEFAILLPETDINGTMNVASRIHTNIRNAAIPHANSQAADIVTLSVGVTCSIPQATISNGDLFKIADQALYSAKAKGRNQTAVLSL
ncbi:diguanylate cyclase [Oscillatoria sp. CS-180]|uniref:diguanylate cyclase n=1 Tax=Oscillatoria sp. CS-180 TaxID=3021720 RepID=UPI00232E1F50|nr:diguanylate cyclase [Oscillatoria sp. CS-180]MDB9529318.1 diguanylate cyclase [Oscillatoria sp. CS-180]